MPEMKKYHVWVFYNWRAHKHGWYAVLNTSTMPCRPQDVRGHWVTQAYDTQDAVAHIMIGQGVEQDDGMAQVSSERARDNAPGRKNTGSDENGPDVDGDAASR